MSVPVLDTICKPTLSLQPTDSNAHVIIHNYINYTHIHSYSKLLTGSLQHI